MTVIPPDPALDSPAHPVPAKAGTGYIWLNIVAMLGVYLAWVTPIAISLAVKVSKLAPDNEEYLGYVMGCGALAALIANPLIGMLSDNSRSRFGRRRPYLLASTAVGLLGLAVMAQSSSIIVLTAGWMIAQAGWAPVLTLLLTSQADRLSESQRGRVSGFSGVVTQLAPIGGTLLVSGFISNDGLMFLVPGGLGALAIVAFALIIREPDARTLSHANGSSGFAALLRSYRFSPRRYPDFAWNWLGKFLIFFGITFNTTFTAFFLADRMDVTVEEVAGTVAVLGMGGILAAVIGAIGGGFLSDRLKRRRIFVLLGAIIFGGGVTVMALSPSVPLIIAAAIVGNLGLGVFGSVDQALTLDVLPERETDGGRYMGIFSFSTTLAQGTAPFIAPLFLGIGSTGGEKNYTLLYLIAAALTLLGGLTIALRVKSVR